MDYLPIQPRQIIGGVLGYLAEQGKSDLDTLRRALVRGTVAASFTIEDFSLRRVQDPRQVIAGLKASLTVDRPHSLIGDEGPILTFALTNVGKRPIKIFSRFEIRWPGTNSAASVGLAITRADGTAYRPAEQISNLTEGPRIEEFTWLAPGQSVSAGPIPLQGVRGIKDVGRFRITASYSNHFVSYVTRDGIVHEEPEVWTGSVVSNAVTIKVEE